MAPSNVLSFRDMAQCATFPIDRGPDLGKNWVGLGKLSYLVARRSMVIPCVLLNDSTTGLQVYTVGLWWIILTLDLWSMTFANTISHTELAWRKRITLCVSCPISKWYGYNCAMDITIGPVITQLGIYLILHASLQVESIAHWTHERHTTSNLHRQTVGCLLHVFQRKLAML